MPRRYEDQEDDRGSQYSGRRFDSDYGRSYRNRSQQGYRYDDTDRETERYRGERDWESDYSGGRYSAGRREYGLGRQRYGGSPQSERDYGEERNRWSGDYGDRYENESRYNRSSGYSDRFQYPTRSREVRGEFAGRYDFDRDRYDRSEYDRDRGERGWWERASDEVASWFGDEEAVRRRRMDEQRQQLRGRGPKGYRRSDERIKEDINDRLSDGYIDASEIEVAVLNTEVVLTGTVNSRSDKRRAEELADMVSGVTNVENRLRVRQSGLGTYTGSETTGTTGTTGATGSSTPSSSATLGRAKGTGS